MEGSFSAGVTKGDKDNIWAQITETMKLEHPRNPKKEEALRKKISNLKSNARLELAKFVKERGGTG